MDKYTKKYMRLIKQAKSDQELSDIIDNIYTDGFDDGEQSAGTPEDKPQDKPLTASEDRYRKVLLNLVEDMETDDDLSPADITAIIKQGSKGYV